MKLFEFDNQYRIDSGGLNGEKSTLIIYFHFLLRAKQWWRHVTRALESPFVKPHSQ